MLCSDLRSTFKLFDKDGNGSISAEELGAILKARGLTPTDDQLTDLVKKYDTNGKTGLLNTSHS